MKKTIITPSIDRAAFLKTMGSRLICINGDYPDNSFKFTVNNLVLFYEKYLGLIPYDKFCYVRKELKIKCRKKAGLPAHFTGQHRTGYYLKDLVKNGR